jgi:hypothetical protein
MNRNRSNISAAAETGSRRSPSPPVRRSERRRITRREAKKRREEIKSNNAGNTGEEGSAAEAREHLVGKEGGQSLGSAPGLGQDRKSSLPLSNSDEKASGPEQATSPPASDAKPQQIPEQENQQG